MRVMTKTKSETGDRSPPILYDVSPPTRTLISPKGSASLLNFIAVALAFIMISWSVLALTQGHYYGTIGVALNWPILGLGIAILLIRFGYVKALRPPLVYLYAGFFLFMFARAMGWLP